MSEETNLEQCGSCGATIYPEHVASRKADRIGGTLLCVHCLRERGGAAAVPALSAVGSGSAATATAGAATSVATAAPAKAKATIQYDRVAERRTDYRRALSRDPALATRCRVFHCRLNEASIRNMEEQINQWIDGNEDICIKFSNSSVGTFEGKAADPHLILTVYY